MGTTLHRKQWFGWALCITLLVIGCGPSREPIYRAMSLESIGDWNGDGSSDFAIGEFERARVLIVSGVDGSVLRMLKGSRDFGWSLCALKLEGEAAFALAVGAPLLGEVAIFGSSKNEPISTVKGERGTFGWGLASFGDVDGDGAEDFATALPKFRKSQNNQQSSGCVVSTRTGERLVEFLDGGEPDLMGFSIAALPSKAGQSNSELLLGCGWVPTVLRFSGETGESLGEFATVGGGVPHSYPIRVMPNVGGEHVVAIGNPDTKDSGTVVLFDREGSEALRLRGTYHGDRFGFAIESLNLSSSADDAGLLITAPGRIKSAGIRLKPVAIKDGNPEGAAPGYVRLYSSADGELLWEYTENRVGDWLGIAACALTDIDGDGFDEAVVGGQFAETGRNYVALLSGADGKVLYELELPD
ncbi:MAG: hypothetical protein ACI8TQ_000533 [Planctomycetota bacterium]|jgi:hypothetical protein